MKTSSRPCPSPEKLSEIAFLVAAGCELSESARRVEAHVGRCGSCAAAYSEYVSIAVFGRSSLRDEVETASCLDENVLAEYFDGVLSEQDRDAVEEHIATCGHCVRQLCELHSLLVNTREPLRKIVLEWLHEGLRVIEASAEVLRPVALSPAPVLKRDTVPASFSWETEQDNYTLRITLQRVSTKCLTMHLLLKFDDVPEPGRRVYVRRDDALVESRTTQEDGTVVLFGLEALDYEVNVEIPGSPLSFTVEFPGSA